MAGLLLDREVLDLLQLAHGLSISTNYVQTVYTAFKLLAEMNPFYTPTPYGPRHIKRDLSDFLAKLS